MSKKQNSKNLKKLVRRRVERKAPVKSSEDDKGAASGVLVRHKAPNKGESYSIARSRIAAERVKVTDGGFVLTGNGQLLPRQVLTVRPAADEKQFLTALLGKPWTRPTERCKECRDWIVDGTCICNAPDPSMEPERVVVIRPHGYEEPPLGEEEARLKSLIEWWISLPEMPLTGPKDAFLASKVGAVSMPTEKALAAGMYDEEPFSPEYVHLGTITLEVDMDANQWQTYRLPGDLGVWAAEHVETARQGGGRVFPAMVMFDADDDYYSLRVDSLREPG